MEVKVSKLWKKTTSLALRNSGQLRHSSQRHNIHGCPRTHLEEVLFNLIWISAGINPLSLLAVCKTHWLQFYKYPFKSKGGVVANIQIDVPSLKNLRREKTLFLISSSLQEWLTKTGKTTMMRKHQLCLQIYVDDSTLQIHYPRFHPNTKAPR